jgi:hypothetical protein
VIARHTLSGGWASVRVKRSRERPSSSRSSVPYIVCSFAAVFAFGHLVEMAFEVLEP